MKDLLLRATRLPGRLYRRANWELEKARLRRELRATGGTVARTASARPAIFFAPEGSLTPHIEALCIVARSLQDRGHPVLLTHCLELFDRCPVMDGTQLPPLPSAAMLEQTCYRCARAGIDEAARFGLPGLSLRDWMTPEITATLERALAALPDDIYSFELDSIPFGKLSVVNVSLAMKISDLRRPSPEAARRWIQYLRTSVLAYLLTDRLIRELRPAALAQYNDYSLGLGVRAAAEKHRVPSFTVAHGAHRNIDRQRIWITPCVTFHQLAREWSHWQRWRDLALPPRIVDEVVEDLIFRFESRGSHNYSPAKSNDGTDVRTRLGLSPDRRLLAVYSSSFDEVVAMDAMLEGFRLEWPQGPRPFRDQLEWLETLVAMVEASSDLQMVIRIHPREGRNKRDQQESQNLARLRTHFAREFRHCRFIWPADPISSYDLARLGVPVAVGSLTMAYLPEDDFILYADTIPGYLDCIRRALAEESAPWDRVVRAFRYHHFLNMAPGVEVSDVVPRPDCTRVPEPRGSKSAAEFEAAFFHGESVLHRGFQRLEEEQGTLALQLESEAIRAGLRRILHFWMTGETTPPASLQIAAGPPAGREDPEIPRLEVRGAQVRYSYRGQIRQRHSPLVARLARLWLASASLTARHGRASAL
jgi:hypothetical protein